MLEGCVLGPAVVPQLQQQQQNEKQSTRRASPRGMATGQRAPPGARTSVYRLATLSGVTSTPLDTPTSTLAAASSRWSARKALAAGGATTMAYTRLTRRYVTLYRPCTADTWPVPKPGGLSPVLRRTERRGRLCVRLPK